MGVNLDEKWDGLTVKIILEKGSILDIINNTHPKWRIAFETGFYPLNLLKRVMEWIDDISDCLVKHSLEQFIDL